MNIASIEKELLPDQRFSKCEVLSDAHDIAWRRKTLERAATFGNLYKLKSRIFFETQEGSRVIETTIWAVTNKYVILKAGMVIPIQCITQVE